MGFAVIILAAGKGTRMKSDLPKVLHPVCFRPMLDHVILAAAPLLPARTIVVVGHDAARVRAHVESLNLPLDFVVQSEQRGTGHATQLALAPLSAFSGTVLVIPGDVPLLQTATLQGLLASHTQVASAATILSAVVDDPTGYGRIVRSASGTVERIVEHRDTTPEQRAIREINTGIIAFDAGFLRSALAALTPNNAQGELYLTDVVKSAAHSGSASALQADNFEEFLGINDRAQRAQLEMILFDRVNQKHMEEGVTIELPTTVRIEGTVQIAPDVTIGPNVTLKGATVIARGARIDVGCVIEDCTIDEGATIKPYSVLTKSRVGPRAEVGPFAHLRPGSELREKSKVGNFVEVKNTTLGTGAKAGHLTYLGDAQIGSNVNVGAGTITCNYDGFVKHQTVVEDGVFIGSNTSLVAPVTIGAGAIVGAGSTITREVHPDALALTRPQQVEKAGYAVSWRKRGAQAKALRDQSKK